MQKENRFDPAPRSEKFKHSIHKVRMAHRIKKQRGFAFSQNDTGQASLIRYGIPSVCSIIQRRFSYSPLPIRFRNVLVINQALRHHEAKTSRQLDGGRCGWHGV
jgi:hypothetical protein